MFPYVFRLKARLSMNSQQFGPEEPLFDHQDSWRNDRSNSWPSFATKPFKTIQNNHSHINHILDLKISAPTTSSSPDAPCAATRGFYALALPDEGSAQAIAAMDYATPHRPADLDGAPHGATAVGPPARLDVRGSGALIQRVLVGKKRSSGTRVARLCLCNLKLVEVLLDFHSFCKLSGHNASLLMQDRQ